MLSSCSGVKPNRLQWLGGSSLAFRRDQQAAGSEHDPDGRPADPVVPDRGGKPLERHAGTRDDPEAAGSLNGVLDLLEHVDATPNHNGGTGLCPRVPDVACHSPKGLSQRKSDEVRRIAGR